MRTPISRRLAAAAVVALVLGMGLAQRADAVTYPIDAQSFCTVGHGAAGTCPVGSSPIDWDVCYDTGGGAAPTGSLSCGAGTSDSAIAVGAGVPVRSWQITTMPAGAGWYRMR